MVRSNIESKRVGKKSLQTNVITLMKHRSTLACASEGNYIADKNILLSNQIIYKKNLANGIQKSTYEYVYLSQKY